MSTGSKCVLLSHGTDTLRIESATSLEAVMRQAEARWGLAPSAYELVDDFGPIKSDASLQRTLNVPNTATCQLCVQVVTKWVEAREMESAMKALEQRVLQKVEEQLARVRLEARFVDSKVNETVAPLLESVAVAKIDAEQRAGALNSLIESMALAQMDLTAKLAEVEAAVTAVKPAAATSSFPQLICIPGQAEEMSKVDVQHMVEQSVDAAVELMTGKLLTLEGDIRGLHDKVDKANAWAGSSQGLGVKQWGVGSAKARDAQDELCPNGANAVTATRQIYLGRSLDKSTLSRSMPQLPPVR